MSLQRQNSDERCQPFWERLVDLDIYKSGDGVGAGVGGVGVTDGAEGTTCGETMRVDGCDAGTDVTACLKSQPV